MSGQTVQLINTIVAALIIAAIIALAKWITGKEDKVNADKWRREHQEDDDKSHVAIRETLSKLEVKLEAALLVVGAMITRPEMAEKMMATTGRMDDKILRIVADIVQLTADSKANTKANAETDKKLDDLPSRVRALEERRP